MVKDGEHRQALPVLESLNTMLAPLSAGVACSMVAVTSAAGWAMAVRPDAMHACCIKKHDPYAHTAPLGVTSLPPSRATLLAPDVHLLKSKHAG